MSQDFKLTRFTTHLVEGKEVGLTSGNKHGRKASSRPNLDEEENDDEISVSGEEGDGDREDDGIVSGEDDLAYLKPKEVAKCIAQEVCVCFNFQIDN